MADSRTLLKHLKARLREQGITYRELAQRLRLSEPTVKRDLSRGRFSLQRLDRICEVLNLTLEELLEAPTRAPPLTVLWKWSSMSATSCGCVLIWLRIALSSGLPVRNCTSAS